MFIFTRSGFNYSKSDTFVFLRRGPCANSFHVFELLFSEVKLEWFGFIQPHGN